MSGDTAAVAVAISTLDRPASLARCLESLARATALPAEVVVVDQSSGGTAAPVVAAAQGRPDVRHVRGARRGLGAGQNEAVRTTRAPVVAVLDDDCVADAEWIARIAALLADGTDVDLVGGRVLPLGDDSAGVPVSTRTSAVPRELRGKILPWELGSGNNFAFRREWFEHVGGCDERLGPGSPARGGVDMDLFYRLVRAGARARYDPDVVVYHERATRSERLARRVPYGRGMAAAAAIWLRDGDRYAVRILGSWLRLRGHLLASALKHGRWPAAYEELLVLGGTAQGLVHGWRVAGRRDAG